MKMTATRRQFLKSVLGTGACAGLGMSLLPPDALAASPALRSLPRGFPYRQDDAAWKDDLMWDRNAVIQTHIKGNRRPRREAEALMRQFEDGNTIGNEGCLLTCLAMVLRLLDPAQPDAGWTPRSLNRVAHELNYYTLAGLSMAPLAADLVCEVSAGEVQMCAKEEYLSGEPGWPRTYVHTSALVRAYRRLAPERRRDFLVMLKTGTYDDTVASHYVLLHPGGSESPDGPDPELLDPAMPLEASLPWRLSDSARRICEDPEIRRAWRKSGIEPNQICGAWIFARWRGPQDRMIMGPLIGAWAAELASS